jgi:hypothetical protein
MFIHVKNIIIIATSELELLVKPKTQDSFKNYSTFTHNNTPPMPLYDAHLGGFLFL